MRTSRNDAKRARQAKPPAPQQAESQTHRRRARVIPAIWLALCFAAVLFGQQAYRPPLVRSWTIREVGNYKKIPTATLRAKMAQRGVLFGVDEPYDQSKVDGTTLLLKQFYKEAGVTVTVVPSRIPVGANFVKVEYVVEGVKAPKQ